MISTKSAIHEITKTNFLILHPQYIPLCRNRTRGDKYFNFCIKGVKVWIAECVVWGNAYQSVMFTRDCLLFAWQRFVDIYLHDNFDSIWKCINGSTIHRTIQKGGVYFRAGGKNRCALTQIRGRFKHLYYIQACELFSHLYMRTRL